MGLKIVFIAQVILTLFFFFSMAFMFGKENENRAVKSLLVLLILLLLFYVLLYAFASSGVLIWFLFFEGFVILIFGVSFFIPYSKKHTDHTPVGQIDERNIMFSRKDLVPGTERYKEYYQQHPENLKVDEKFRREPGLLSPNSKYYQKDYFDLANDYFKEVDLLQPRVCGEVVKEKKLYDKHLFSEELKNYIKDIGALAVGITATHPYHFYSYKGRGKYYGKKINNTHKTAIAFTVEMDYKRVMAAPKAPIVAESAFQYLNTGSIAVTIAEKLRNMGYDSRAHIDGNYELICPLVARDAGLGEIGRMGLLMTPNQGPRVRIAVVTTEMELEENEYRPDYSVMDFCNICKKCAVCCPGQSISYDPPKKINGVLRWKINQEACYTLWCKAGTDCGRCMAVCPYSHPNTFWHKLIRLGVKKSFLFRHIAVVLDDFFYGRKPKSKKIPLLKS